MSPFDSLNKKGAKPLPTLKRNVRVETITVHKSPTIRSISNVNGQSFSPVFSPNAKSRASSGSPSVDSRKSTPSRNGKIASLETLKSNHRADRKRSSPATSTPRFDSDEEEEEVAANATKKRKLSESKLDRSRQIRAESSFVEDQEPLSMIHAAVITNPGTRQQPNPKFARLFVTSGDDASSSEQPTPVELQYPSTFSRERYYLAKPDDKDDFEPVREIIDTISTIGRYYLPESAATAIFEDSASGIPYQLERAYKRVDEVTFRATLEKFNHILATHRKSGIISDHLDNLHHVPLPLVQSILLQIYNRTVSPRVSELRRYENGTDNVYGELLPKFLSKIFADAHLKSKHVFVDLGSGVGNCVLQAALEIGCESWGCEMMPNACDLAELQHKEFKARCQLWGLRPGAVRLERGNFLENQPINEVLKRADLVLVNNQAFTPKLNDDLKRHFLDMKEGAQLVSLKGFVSEASKRNTGDVMNIFIDEQKQFWSESVSWTNAGGTYHVATKDSKRFLELNGGLDN